MESGNIPEGVLDGEFCLRAIRLSLPCKGTYYTRHQAPRAQHHFELSQCQLQWFRFAILAARSTSSTERGGFALLAGDASVDSWFREIYVLRACLFGDWIRFSRKKTAFVLGRSEFEFAFSLLPCHFTMKET